MFYHIISTTYKKIGGLFCPAYISALSNSVFSLFICIGQVELIDKYWTHHKLKVHTQPLINLKLLYLFQHLKFINVPIFSILQVQENGLPVWISMPRVSKEPLSTFILDCHLYQITPYGMSNQTNPLKNCH